MGLLALATILLAGVAASALPVALRHRDHRPFAAYAAVVVVKAAARIALARAIVVAEGAGPLTGVRRAAFHAEEALFLLGPAGIVALSLVVMLGRATSPRAWWDERDSVLFLASPWTVGTLWAASSVAISIGYPVYRGAVLERIYDAVEAASLVACASIFFAWRLSAGDGRRPSSPSATQTCVVLVIGVELVVALVGPWTRGLFAPGAWRLAQAAYCVLYLFLLRVQLGVLWGTRSIRV